MAVAAGNAAAAAEAAEADALAVGALPGALSGREAHSHIFRCQPIAAVYRVKFKALPSGRNLKYQVQENT